MLKRLLPYGKKYRLFAILCPLLMVLEISADILIPFFMSYIVDTGIANRDINYIFKIGSLMVGLALLGMLLGITSTFFGARAGYGFAAEIRSATYKKLQDFSFSNIDSISPSSLITRLTTDIDLIGQVSTMTLRMAVRAPSMMIFALAMAIRVNSQLALIFGVAIPIVAITIIVLMGKAMPIFTKYQERIDGINAIVQEDLIGMQVIKSFNRQEYEEERFKKRNDDLRNFALKAVSLIIFMMPVINLVIYGCIVAVLWFGGNMIISGTMAPGELIAFITYITQVLMALMMLSFYFLTLTRGRASGARIVEVLDIESSIKEKDEPIKEIEDGSIDFEDVCFRYETSRENILKNIDLHIDSGEMVGIIGSTGSAKSTLVQMIPRLYDVNLGSVKVSGKNVRDYELEFLRDKIAFVLQKNTLVSGTIRSNLNWGKENASDEEIIDALKKSQAWEFVSQYDDTIDHIVEQGGANFSGGQKQRLTIARALMKDPKIIILDDSSSALDMATDRKLRKVLKEELSDITTIMIAQRIASIKDADKIVVMEKGSIDAIGKHDELMEKSKIYKEIAQSQEGGISE